MVKIKLRGFGFVWIRQEGLRINYEERIRNVENVLNNWHNKSLTLIGR